jgi:hypothetical protein
MIMLFILSRCQGMHLFGLEKLHHPDRTLPYFLYS